MKVAILSHQFPPQSGGIGQWAYALAQAWPHECMCYTPAVADPDQPIPFDGITVRPDTDIPISGFLAFRKKLNRNRNIPVPTYSLWRQLDWRRVRSTLNWLMPLMEQSQTWDTIISASADPAGIAGCLAAALTGKPHVVLVHGAELLALKSDTHRSRWTRPVLHLADGCIANSRFTTRLLREEGIPDHRIHVSHPGVSDAYCKKVDRPSNPSDQGPVLITVANLIPRKGHDRIIRLLPALIECFPTLRYWIVGEGPERANLEALAQGLNVKDHCRFMGRVAEDQLDERYRQADCFIMPGRQIGSEVEGFGIAFVEASARGLPVIGSRVGGCADAIKDGETGFLVSPDDDRELLDKTVQLLSDGALRQRMGAAGQQWICTELTWSKGASQILQVLQNINAHRRGNP